MYILNTSGLQGCFPVLCLSFPSVRAGIFRLLGLFCELYPEHSLTLSERLISIFMRTLKSEVHYRYRLHNSFEWWKSCSQTYLFFMLTNGVCIVVKKNSSARKKLGANVFIPVKFSLYSINVLNDCITSSDVVQE